MKPNTLTDRENEIIASATHYCVRRGTVRTTHTTREEAYAAADGKGAKRGALVYAVGTACGVTASALVATWCARHGLQEIAA